jgi:flap endonuclease-1
MAPSSANQPIQEFDLAVALDKLGLTRAQFIDLCIMCGCDYCGSIRGIGPVRALEYIRKHGSLDGVLAALDTGKYPLPEPYPYREAAAFFASPDVTPAGELPPLKWAAPDVDGLVAFLVGEKSFAEDRVRKAVERINAAKGKASQGRLEAFFGPVKVVPNAAKAAKEAAAREAAKAAKKKGGAAGGKAGPLKGGVKKAPIGKPKK